MFDVELHKVYEVKIPEGITEYGIESIKSNFKNYLYKAADQAGTYYNSLHSIFLTIGNGVTRFLVVKNMSVTCPVVLVSWLRKCGMSHLLLNSFLI